MKHRELGILEVGRHIPWKSALISHGCGPRPILVEWGKKQHRDVSRITCRAWSAMSRECATDVVSISEHPACVQERRAHDRLEDPQERARSD